MTECYTPYLTSTNSNVILQNLSLQLGKDLEDYYKGVSGALSPTDSMTKYQNSLKVLFTSTGTNYSNNPALDSSIKAYVKCIVDKYTPTIPPTPTSKPSPKPTKFVWPTWATIIIIIVAIIVAIILGVYLYREKRKKERKRREDEAEAKHLLLIENRNKQNDKKPPPPPNKPSKEILAQYQAGIVNT